MEISKQVTSRILSERLKALNVPQESYFKWDWNFKDEKGTKDCFISTEGDVSAFTASELGEMLPQELYFFKSGTLWNVLSLEGSKIADALPLTFGHGDIAEDNLAEAMGKMLEYLIKSGIIKP